MAVIALACGHLMPTQHLGTMSGPHKQRGRSGSQPLTPTHTSSLAGWSFIHGPLLTASVSLCPSAHEQRNQPTTHKGTAVYQMRGAALPTLYMRLPQGEESQEATGGLLLGQPKTEQAGQQSLAAEAVCTTEPPPTPPELEAAPSHEHADFRAACVRLPSTRAYLAPMSGPN